MYFRVSPPAITPEMQSKGRSRNSPKKSGGKSKDKHKDKEHIIYYAGARFEVYPSHITLPSPPLHWISPQRSQSLPSTPVPIIPMSVNQSQSQRNSSSSFDLATYSGHVPLTTSCSGESRSDDKRT